MWQQQRSLQQQKQQHKQQQQQQQEHKVATTTRATTSSKTRFDNNYGPSGKAELCGAGTEAVAGALEFSNKVGAKHKAKKKKNKKKKNWGEKEERCWENRSLNHQTRLLLCCRWRIACGWLVTVLLFAFGIKEVQLDHLFSASWSKPRDNDSLKPNEASFLSPRICTYTYMYVHLYVCMYVHSRSFVGQRNGLFSSFSSHKGKKIMYLQNSIWSKMASAKHKSAVSPCRMRHLVCMYVWMYVRMYVCILWGLHLSVDWQVFENACEQHFEHEWITSNRNNARNVQNAWKWPKNVWKSCLRKTVVYHHATLHNKIESLFFDLFVSVWLIGSQQNYASEKFRPDPFFSRRTMRLENWWWAGKKGEICLCQKIGIDWWCI